MNNCCMNCNDRWINIDLGTRCHTECNKYKELKNDIINKKKSELYSMLNKGYNYESKIRMDKANR